MPATAFAAYTNEGIEKRLYNVEEEQTTEREQKEEMSFVTLNLITWHLQEWKTCKDSEGFEPCII